MQVQELDDKGKVEHWLDKIGTHVVLKHIKSRLKSRACDVGTMALRGHAAAGQLNTLVDGMIMIGCGPVGMPYPGVG